MLDFKIMNEEKYWKIIREVSWKKDFDFKRIKKELSNEKLLPIKDRKKFLEIQDKLKDNLRNYLSGLDDKVYSDFIGESDDGLSDLVAHIVGLGKTKYYKCLKNYKEASKHSYWNAKEDKDKRVENFFYSSHDLIDFVQENKEKYEKLEKEQKTKKNKKNEEKIDLNGINNNVGISF